MATVTSAPEVQVTGLVCPNCHGACGFYGNEGEGDEMCIPCRGTGRRYWWLVNKCTVDAKFSGGGEHGVIRRSRTKSYWLRCHLCDGTGWVLNVTLEGLLDVVFALGCTVSIVKRENETGVALDRWVDAETFLGVGKTPQEALARAILRAKGGRLMSYALDDYFTPALLDEMLDDVGWEGKTRKFTRNWALWKHQIDKNAVTQPENCGDMQTYLCIVGEAFELYLGAPDAT